MQAIHSTLSAVVSAQINTDSLFMHKICGTLKPDGTRDEIEQSSHQLQFVLSVLAPHLGLGLEPKFDLSAQLIYEGILKTSVEDMLKLFYDNMDLNKVLAQIMEKFNAILCPDGKLNKTVYNSVMELLPAGAGETAFVTRYIDEEEISEEVVGISETGMLHLLSSPEVEVLKKATLKDGI